MSLGEKLQKAYEKVNKKLGTQDGPVDITIKTHTAAAEFGRAHTATSETTVSISEGLKIERMKSYEIAPSGPWRQDDIKLIIPGNLVTEDQLDQAVIEYGDKTYSIAGKFPTEIYGGVVVQWRVIARRKQ